MADKILQTRIINKNADLSAWNSSTLPLKKGEIALAKFDAQTTNPLDGSITTTPAYAIKVGLDDTKAFKDCAWLYAPASDVHAWAKAATKPDYISSEISRGEGKTSVEEALVALESAVGGSGSVATMIESAINALDVDASTDTDGVVISSISETDGKISVTRRALDAADIPTLEIAKINGLQTALDGKAIETSVAERFAAVDTRLDTGDIKQAIDAAQQAGDDAQADIDAYKTSNDAALAEVRGIAEAATTVEEATQIATDKVTALENGQVKTNKENITANATAISEEVTRAKGVESGLDTRLTAAEEAITTLNAATTLEGVGTLEERPAVGKSEGAIWIATDNNKEYVWDGSKWVELGDTTAELQAISDLTDRVSAVETDLGENGETTLAIAAAKKAADDAQADADAANDAIAVINGSAEGSIAKAVADAKTELQGYADTAEADAISTAKAYTDTEVKKASDKADAAQSAIDTHAGSKENPHEVTKAQVGLSNVDNKSVAEIKTEFTGAVADGNDKFVTGDAVYDAIEAAKTAAASDAAAKVKVVADDLDAAEADISTIKNNFARVEGDALVYGQGDDVMTIIFDCGGAV